jgi:two-component system CheB/CheR fusion protein
LLKKLQVLFGASESDYRTSEAVYDEQPATIYIVDDETLCRQNVSLILDGKGLELVEFPSCEGFLKSYRPSARACIVLDVKFPGMSGMQLLKEISGSAHLLPVIVLSGSCEIREAVESMKYGAVDFVEKPVSPEDLLESVKVALLRSSRASAFRASRKSALSHLALLTPRQQQIMDRVLRGQPSKIIASDLGISQRTVENHRAAIMHKMGAKSLPALSEMVLEAVWRPADEATARC